MLFFLEAETEKPLIFDLQKEQTKAFGPARSITLPEAPVADYLADYQMAWHPDGKLVVFYNHYGFYLADATSGQLCEIDLGEKGQPFWALSAKWSPSGRYLAARYAYGKPAVPFIDLALIDTFTGERQMLDLGVQRDIYAMAWANQEDLLLVARNPQVELRHDLYLFNTATGDAKQILADYEFIDSGSSGVAWSPTGDAIALACPAPTDLTEGKDRLCIIYVEVEQ